MTLDTTPEKSCEVCAIGGVWSYQAVNLEGLIKGGFLTDGTEPNPLWNFNDLRNLVRKGQKQVEGEISQLAKDSADIKGALALIDYFANPENVQTTLSYFQLGDYAFQPASTQAVDENKFLFINDHPLPGELAAVYQAIRDQVQSQTGRLLTLASGFRSPAYQLYLMCAGSYIRQRDGITPSLDREFKKIAPPYCSKHSDGTNPALDIADFIPNDANALEDADTCERMREHTVWQVFAEIAEQYGFIENYPKGSINDKAGEPWEWQKITPEADALIKGT